MNLGTLAALAAAKAFGPEEDQRGLAVNDLLVRSFINSAYHRIERAATWKFSEARATLLFDAGSAYPTNQPDDIGLVLHLTDERGCTLAFHDLRQVPVGNRYRGPSMPLAYSIWSDQLEVHPAPARATSLDLHYYRRWADLVADSDVPLIPEAWHEILTDFAAAQTLLRTPPRAGRDLAESHARPFLDAWERGLGEMLDSPLVMVTADTVIAHEIADAAALGHGVDW